MSTDEKVAVFRAWCDGEKIQHYNPKFSAWVDCRSDPAWNFMERDYRVKPKPHKLREWWLATDENGQPYNGCYSIKTEPSAHYKRIHVREVLP